MPDIGSAKLFAKETFESWDTFTNTTGILSVNSSIGQWVVSNAVSCVTDEAGKCLHLLNNSRMYLPNLGHDIVYVRFKTRTSTPSSYSRTLYFGTILADDSTWYNSVQPPSSTELSTYSLITKEISVKGCYFEISCKDGCFVDIDDLEIWTIPRATGE